MKDDYSDVIFSQGLVCLNTNNNAICVVVDGAKGKVDDRCSLVIEFNGMPYMIHTPPNRALKPTGKILNLKPLAKMMQQYVVIDE